MTAHRGYFFSALLAVTLGTAAAAEAGAVIDGVKAQGQLRCGVSEGVAGFSQRDPGGRWRGLDVDFCRAVAAAVLGDGAKVSFVPLKSSERLPALQGRKVDLLLRNTTWTLTREAVLKIQFPGILFYDSQAIMVPDAAGVKTVEALKGATVCVEKGTNHGRNLEDYFRTHGWPVTVLVSDTAAGAAQAFFAGRCGALTSDASQLAGVRLDAPGGPAAYRILAQRIAKEPLAPALWGGDPEWTTAVRWVLFGLIQAEESGITQDNVDAGQAAGQGLFARLSTDQKGQLAQSLGLSPGWAARAVRAVGNYGEMYERNLGGGSPLAIERGPNRLWNQGGLMYAPPID